MKSMPTGHLASISNTRRLTGRTILLLAGLATLFPAIACEQQARTGKQDPAQIAAEREKRQASVREHLERTYTVGPMLADSIGYTVKWQYQVPTQAIKLINPEDDLVFILTARNDLTCLQAGNGRKVWTVSVAKEVQEVQSVTFIPESNLVLILTDSELLTLNASTGMEHGASVDQFRQHLERTSNTPGTLSGEYMLYGARSGQLVWQAWRVGYEWRSYQVDHAIQLAPVISGNTVTAIGPSGVIIQFDIHAASQLWRTQLLDNIVAEPVANNQALYVAGLDQHLRAFDLQSGRTLWRVLTDTALVDSPVLIGQNVYQQIPGKGLASYAALPVNKLDGELNWLSETVSGTVVTRNGSQLVTWDATSETLETISISRGTPIRKQHLPHVTRVVSTRLEGSPMYVVAKDGRVVCLEPNN